MGADPPEGCGERVDFGDESPGPCKCIFQRDTGSMPLRDQADPAPYIATIGAADLARGCLIDLGRMIGRRNPLRDLLGLSRLVRHISHSFVFLCREISAFRWRMRCDIVFSRLTASKGSSLILVNNAFLSTLSTLASPTARTVAERISFSNTAISPKKSPASRNARCCSPPFRES